MFTHFIIEVPKSPDHAVSVTDNKWNEHDVYKIYDKC